MVADATTRLTTLVFTYGTLKQGFSNHTLIQDLIRKGDAAYVGPHRTSDRYPLVCGPYRVPFLIDFRGKGERVRGEVYAVSRQGLARMDELEGIGKGHYQRGPIAVVWYEDDDGDVEGEEVERRVVQVQAYFAHGSYAMGLWRKSGEKGYGVYSEKEARGYVKRVDRPEHLTFLQQIQAFLGEECLHY